MQVRREMSVRTWRGRIALCLQASKVQNPTLQDVPSVRFGIEQRVINLNSLLQGVCSYGNRCNFLHAETEDELVKQRIKQQSQRRMSVPNVRLMTVRKAERRLTTLIVKFHFFQNSIASLSLNTIGSSQNEQRLPTFRRLSLSD